MYAIIKYQGHQFKVEKDRWLLVPKIKEAKEGDSVDIDNVLIFKDDKESHVGAPYLSNVTVKAKVVEPLIKDKKVIVFKYKRRKDYRKKQGHRQQFSKILIEDIQMN